MKKYISAVLVITNVITLILLAILYAKFRAQSGVIATVSQPTPDAELQLPSDAVKISECVPYEGEHYVQPSKLPYGPLYVVYQGKVTALEFMFKPDAIPGEKAAKLSQSEADALIKKNNLKLSDLVMSHAFQFDLLGAKYKSIGMNWSSPHSGLADPHYDIHAYLIDSAEMQTICPNARLEDVYSSQVMENITKYKIPFPSTSEKK